MPAKEFELTDIGSVSIYKRRNARAIKITILHAGGVRVTIPSWLPYRAGLEYAKSKQGWIKLHQKQQINLLNGKRVGKYHRLVFVAANTSVISARVSSSEVIVTHPFSQSVQDSNVQARAVLASEKALRQEASALLPQRLDQLAHKYGYSYKGVSIKKLKSRWGSCNNKQHISLSLYLMLLPWELIDYVLIHELNHTNHLNHSSEFWAEIEKHLPQAKLLRRQLKVYQPTL